MKKFVILLGLIAFVMIVTGCSGFGGFTQSSTPSANAAFPNQDDFKDDIGEID